MRKIPRMAVLRSTREKGILLTRFYPRLMSSLERASAFRSFRYINISLDDGRYSLAPPSVAFYPLCRVSHLQLQWRVGEPSPLYCRRRRRRRNRDRRRRRQRWRRRRWRWRWWRRHQYQHRSYCPHRLPMESHSNFATQFCFFSFSQPYCWSTSSRWYLKRVFLV